MRVDTTRVEKGKKESTLDLDVTALRERKIERWSQENSESNVTCTIVAVNIQHHPSIVH